MKARENPFSMDRVERFRYRPLSCSWGELLERLVSLEYRGAIVGPEGSGKTTLLEDLRDRLGGTGFGVRWGAVKADGRGMSAGEWKEMLSGLTVGDIILFDGADHLSWLDWQRLRWRSRRAGGLVVAVHREGMLPTLLKTRTTPGLLGEMITELTGRECPDVEVLYGKHRGNIREAIREMYDRMAEA